VNIDDVAGLVLQQLAQAKHSSRGDGGLGVGAAGFVAQGPCYALHAALGIERAGGIGFDGGRAGEDGDADADRDQVVAQVSDVLLNSSQGGKVVLGDDTYSHLMGLRLAEVAPPSLSQASSAHNR